MMKHRIFALIVLLCLGACASNLKNVKDFESIPSELRQKIDLVKVSPEPEEEVKKETIAKPQKKKLQEKKVYVSPSKKSEKIVSTKSKKIVKKPDEKKLPVQSSESKKKEPRWPFGVGEKLTYVLRYGPIEGGVATLEVGALQSLEGEPVLHYVAKAKSYKFFDFFYKVDNRLESWVRLKDHLPLRQEIILNESGQWGKRVVIFNPEKKTQKYYSRVTRKGKKAKVVNKSHQLKNNPQDIFGAGYFYRFLHNLDEVNYPIHDRTKHWNNRFEFIENESVKIKGKLYQTKKYKLYPRESGKSKIKGNITVWLSDDPYKYMVKFKGKIAIGSITGELVSYQPGRTISKPLPVLRTPTSLNEMGVLK